MISDINKNFDKSIYLLIHGPIFKEPTSNIDIRTWFGQK